MTQTRRTWRLLVPLVFAGAGLLATTSATTARGTDLRGERGDLAAVIRADSRRADAAAAEVARLRSEVDALTARAGRRNSPVAGLEARARELGQVAGTVPVTGSGLEVVLDDAPERRPPDGFSPDDLVVHQQDMQAVVNALWAGGAEAMMLMDQRVISTSAVRCVGNVLILQDRVYSPPYKVTAIGDPERMRAALSRSPQVRVYQEYVDVLGLGYDVRSVRSITVPAFDGPLGVTRATTPQSATPSAPGSSTPSTPGGTRTSGTTPTPSGSRPSSTRSAA